MKYYFSLHLHVMGGGGGGVGGAGWHAGNLMIEDLTGYWGAGNQYINPSGNCGK